MWEKHNQHGQTCDLTDSTACHGASVGGSTPQALVLGRVHMTQVVRLLAEWYFEVTCQWSLKCASP